MSGTVAHRPCGFVPGLANVSVVCTDPNAMACPPGHRRSSCDLKCRRVQMWTPLVRGRACVCISREAMAARVHAPSQRQTQVTATAQINRSCRAHHHRKWTSCHCLRTIHWNWSIGATQQMWRDLGSLRCGCSLSTPRNDSLRQHCPQYTTSPMKHNTDTFHLLASGTPACRSASLLSTRTPRRATSRSSRCCTRCRHGCTPRKSACLTCLCHRTPCPSGTAHVGMCRPLRQCTQNSPGCLTCLCHRTPCPSGTAQCRTHTPPRQRTAGTRSMRRTHRRHSLRRHHPTHRPQSHIMVRRACLGKHKLVWLAPAHK